MRSLTLGFGLLGSAAALTCFNVADMSSSSSDVSCRQGLDDGTTFRQAFYESIDNHCRIFNNGREILTCYCNTDLCNGEAVPILRDDDHSLVPDVATDMFPVGIEHIAASAVHSVYLWANANGVYAGLVGHADLDQTDVDAFTAALAANSMSFVSTELGAIATNLILLDSTTTHAIVQLTANTPPAVSDVVYAGKPLTGSGQATDAADCEARCDASDVCAGFTYWSTSNWCKLFASTDRTRPASNTPTTSGASSTNACVSTVDKRFDLTDAGNTFLSQSDTVANEHVCCDTCAADPSCVAFHYKLSKTKCVLLSQADGATVDTQKYGVMGYLAVA